MVRLMKRGTFCRKGGGEGSVALALYLQLAGCRQRVIGCHVAFSGPQLQELGVCLGLPRQRKRKKTSKSPHVVLFGGFLLVCCAFVAPNQKTSQHAWPSNSCRLLAEHRLQSGLRPRSKKASMTAASGHGQKQLYPDQGLFSQS